MPLSTQARQHRADLSELARLAENDLTVIFRDVSSAELVKEALNDVLPKLVAVYGSAAASLGADWYEDMRDRAEAKGRFSPIVADLPDLGRTESLAGFAVGPLFGPDPDAATALSKVSGGLQRIIFNADRFTVTGSATQDKRAGWVREGNGECDWCQRYLDGEVHYVEGYDFDAHDRCQCVAVPVFG